MTYAKDTAVPVERSRAELERTLERYGADTFMYGWDQNGAAIQFRAHGRHVRFVLPLPAKDDTKFTTYMQGPTRRRRSDTAALEKWEQACRQRWRALNLVVKAKLEAVESGITIFDDEFLAHIVLPDGGTAGDWLRPQIEEAYQSGQMPAKLALELPPGPSA